MGVIGVDPDKFWRYTLRELNLIAKAYQENQELEWLRARRLEFAIRKSAYIPACMSKKGSVQAFKDLKTPKDVYPLNLDDSIVKKVVVDKDRMRKAVLSSKELLIKRINGNTNR